MENWAKLLLLDQHHAFQLLQQIMQMIYECDFIPLCMCACVSFTESKLASWHCIPYPPPLGQHIQACVLQQTHTPIIVSGRKTVFSTVIGFLIPEFLLQLKVLSCLCVSVNLVHI